MTDQPDAQLQPQETSVLFCDIKSYTRIAMLTNPVDLERLLRSYILEMDQLISLYCGRIDKIMGDGMVVLFDGGEDTSGAAVCAVECALAMQSKVRELESTWGRYCPELPLRIRIAVATGSVCTGDIQIGTRHFHTIVGEKVNFAARLQERAKPGGTVICQKTMDLIPGNYPWKKLARLELKGFPNDYTAYTLEPAGPVSEPTGHIQIEPTRQEMEFQYFNLYCADYLPKLLFHEFHRTRRYGHEFSCLVLNINAQDRQFASVYGRELERLVLETIRDTDLLISLGDMVFVILAPETMENRLATMRGRIVNRLLDSFPMKTAHQTPEVMTGSFSFNGANADTPSEILLEALIAAGLEGDEGLPRRLVEQPSTA